MYALPHSHRLCATRRHGHFQRGASGRIATRFVPRFSTGSSSDAGATSFASVGDEEPTRVAWYSRECPGFQDIHSMEELNQVLSVGDKMVVLELYAGWCSSCKGAFPGLCKLPSLGDNAKHYKFLKANIDNEDVKNFIKAQEVRGIPHVLVFDTDGKRLIGQGASFKKIDTVRKNLEYIAECKAKGMPMVFTLDPNQFAVQRS